MMNSYHLSSRTAFLCTFVPTLFVASVAAVTSAVAEDAATWPQWRGPARTGIIEAAAWPDSLEGEHLQQIWRVELGNSYSGPIVSRDRVFVTETRNAKTEYVQALDRNTGKSLWEASWDGSISVPFFAKANGDWIRSTPALDEESLYVAGIRDVVVCLETSTGKERWRADLMAKFNTPVPAFGFVASPLVLGDYVYVQAGGGFVKLDKKTGEVVWRVLEDGGGMYGSAFASPFPAKLNGVPQIIVQTRQKLAGIDADSGKVLWSQPVKADQGMNILTPTVIDNKVFTSTYGGGSVLFEISQPNSSETAAVSEVWKTKPQGYMSSPIVIGNHIYLHLRNQRFTCLDVATGKESWTTTPYGKYWSMVANGSKILALDERGDLLLINANPEKFDLLDSRKIAENSWAHVAVVGDQVFVRELNAMTVYRWK
ncbi:MAG TPA: PQQ-binding-like beta-propeller repeat protein [Planctomycetaceae bacterium]|nr:PQQ-binding-like beta-propeller repeat protein [Planctomycetaceae bacterium]